MPEYVVTPDSTQSGFDTPHGFNTPHRFPQELPTSIDIGNLAQTLYPTGRAFNLPAGGDFKALHDAFNDSLIDLITQAYQSLDDRFPDNPNFDAADCSLWEYRLGIPYNSTLTLVQRRNNIYIAMAFPQNILARQHYLYIQQSLQNAGFDVYVYENIFFDGDGNLYQKTPQDITGGSLVGTQYGGTTQYGGATQYGGSDGSDVIANSDKTESYSTGGILWPTFFLAGSTITTFANVPTARQTEYRRLVLKLKPAHTVAFNFVNYT